MAGCFEKCPFCGEMCDYTHVHGDDVQHHVEQHRPQCVAGWREESTEIMSLGICASLVTGEDKKFTDFLHPKTNVKPHPYKFYQEMFPDWRIPADLSSDVVGSLDPPLFGPMGPNTPCVIGPPGPGIPECLDPH